MLDQPSQVIVMYAFRGGVLFKLADKRCIFQEKGAQKLRISLVFDLMDALKQLLVKFFHILGCLGDIVREHIFLRPTHTQTVNVGLQLALIGRDLRIDLHDLILVEIVDLGIQIPDLRVQCSRFILQCYVKIVFPGFCDHFLLVFAEIMLNDMFSLTQCLDISHSLLLT